ncbi:hypothetical protein [Bradyrhizobium sp. NP1]|uniref:hypothetical protein n=1 Tax=Bradyrhizobium sp. NP1 TaxID=3049772 RepID=UPI0025A54908|nr:hypothetical protein [Bradyrhizobium sp. NP1]WJR77392.1 hypothetical protein QOU61_32470 [Bradyrhizobium sp. NP1]
MAYSLVAARENQTVRKQRDSALITLANARVLESEGWQVTITDADGRPFDAAELEKRFPEFARPATPAAIAPAPEAPASDALSPEAAAAASAEASTPEMLAAETPAPWQDASWAVPEPAAA